MLVHRLSRSGNNVSCLNRNNVITGLQSSALGDGGGRGVGLEGVGGKCGLCLEFEVVGLMQWK